MKLLFKCWIATFFSSLSSLIVNNDLTFTVLVNGTGHLSHTHTQRWTRHNLCLSNTKINNPNDSGNRFHHLTSLNHKGFFFFSPLLPHLLYYFTHTLKRKIFLFPIFCIFFFSLCICIFLHTKHAHLIDRSVSYEVDSLAIKSSQLSRITIKWLASVDESIKLDEEEEEEEE